MESEIQKWGWECVLSRSWMNVIMSKQIGEEGPTAGFASFLDEKPSWSKEQRQRGHDGCHLQALCVDLVPSMGFHTQLARWEASVTLMIIVSINNLHLRKTQKERESLSKRKRSHCFVFFPTCILIGLWFLSQLKERMKHLKSYPPGKLMSKCLRDERHGNVILFDKNFLKSGFRNVIVPHGFQAAVMLYNFIWNQIWSLSS